MGTFIAHLHPLLVHLPIGFIIISILIDWHQKNNISVSRDKLSTFMWGMSALASIVAMATGIASLRTGYYEGLNMFIHLICGYAIAAVCTFVWFAKWKNKTYFKGQNIVLKSLLGIGLVVGGHMGGQLTHGEEHLPMPLDPKSDLAEIDLSEKDSISIYGDIVSVIFKQKCNRCHEEDDARGRLIMTTEEGLLSDKYGDPAIAPGDLHNSEVYKRISMSTWNNKYMPPSGPPITYKEKKLVEWWIMQGAPFGGNLREMEINKEMQAFLKAEYGVDLTKKSFYEKAKIDVLPPENFEAIKSVAFNVTNLAANNNFIDVSNHGQSKNISSDRIDALLGAKEHITWLDLNDTDLNDDGLRSIAQMSNLTKLNINRTKITDAGLDAIADLERLMVLNLYGTEVTDAGLEKLTGLKTLESLYLWQTQTTEEGIEKLRSSLPNCKIVTGI